MRPRRDFRSLLKLLSDLIDGCTSLAGKLDKLLVQLARVGLLAYAVYELLMRH